MRFGLRTIILVHRPQQHIFLNIVWISIAVSAALFSFLFPCRNDLCQFRVKTKIASARSYKHANIMFKVYCLCKKPFWKYVIRKRYIMLRNCNMMYHGWPKTIAFHSNHKLLVQEMACKYWNVKFLYIYKETKIILNSWVAVNPPFSKCQKCGYK